MKPYLIIHNENYHPSFGTLDWIETYETLEEAEKIAEGLRIAKRFTTVTVVNLLDWINK